jgi:hypothetical protein
MNRAYLRNEPIRDELVFIGTHLFMTKCFGERQPMNPKTSRNRFFVSAAAIAVLVIAGHRRDD